MGAKTEISVRDNSPAQKQASPTEKGQSQIQALQALI